MYGSIFGVVFVSRNFLQQQPRRSHLPNQRQTSICNDNNDDNMYGLFVFTPPAFASLTVPTFDAQSFGQYLGDLTGVRYAQVLVMAGQCELVNCKEGLSTSKNTAEEIGRRSPFFMWLVL